MVNIVLGGPQAQQLMKEGGLVPGYRLLSDGLGRDVPLGGAFEIARKPEIEAANYGKT